MKDRIPTKPGRVQLVPVTGQTNLYDMTMADEPTEAGTALNKANLLSDAAAQAVWPNVLDRPSDPVPSEAFIALGNRRTVLLADYTVLTGATKVQFDLSENIELFNELDIWVVQPSSGSYGSFGILWGDFTFPSTGTFQMLGIAPSGANAGELIKIIILKNDSAGCEVMSTSTIKHNNPPFNFFFLSSGPQMTGKTITLSRYNSGAGGPATGVRIVIVGRAY